MLTADGIRRDLSEAFHGNHGAGCECCAPFAGGRSALELELLKEARYAVMRYERETAGDGPTEPELDALAEAAAIDALMAARYAITERAVRGLAPGARREPIVAPFDPATERVACQAETFDGSHRRQCTRPASFTRDGLLVCKQHVRLERLRLATPAGYD